MQIDFPKLVITDRVRPFLREIVGGKCDRDIPQGWTGIMIYHPASEQYYASKSTSPLEYELIVRERIEPRFSDLAIALRAMLDHHPEYQFFILPTVGRAVVEQWMAEQGKRRVATRMGDAATREHVMFEVFSPLNKIKRYIGAPNNATRREIIGQANASIAQWLSSSASQHKHERETMRVALRSKFDVNDKVFENQSVVTPTTAFVGRKHNEFRTMLIEKNLEAIRDFIQTTVVGQ